LITKIYLDARLGSYSAACWATVAAAAAAAAAVAE